MTPKERAAQVCNASLVVKEHQVEDAIAAAVLAEREQHAPTRDKLLALTQAVNEVVTDLALNAAIFRRRDEIAAAIRARGEQT